MERLICADAGLSTLDGALGAEVKKALAAAPANRQTLLADARNWLKERDKRCPAPSGALAASDASRVGACLKTIYRERIAQLQAASARNPAPAKSPAGKTVICERLVHDYRAVLEAPSQTPGESPANDQSPLTLLSEARNPSVVIAKPIVEFEQYSQAKVIEWARKRPQPFAFSASVLKELEDMTEVQRIDQLPDADYFVATVIQGTAHCYAQAYFKVQNGQAVSAEAPAAREDGGCGGTNGFGVIAGTKFAYEEDHGYGPSLTSSVTMTPWEADHFGQACTVTLAFAPRFDPHNSVNSSSESEKSCEGADCEELRQAALALVEQLHSDFAGVKKSAVARLTPAQAKDYEALKSLAGAAGEAAGEPATDANDLLDTAPLALPLIHNGQLYLASVGHSTIGWRVFSDWRVKLERLQDGQLTTRADLIIGMGRGRLMKATVE